MGKKEKYSQPDWCNQGQIGTMESRTMVCSTWNLKQHRRRHSTNGKWNYWVRVFLSPPLFLVGWWERDERISCRASEVLVFSSIKRKLKKHEQQGTQMTVSGSSTSSQTECVNQVLECSCEPTMIQLVSSRTSQADLLPSRAEGWKSVTNVWLKLHMEPC